MNAEFEKLLYCVRELKSRWNDRLWELPDANLKMLAVMHGAAHDTPEELASLRRTLKLAAEFNK